MVQRVVMVQMVMQKAKTEDPFIRDIKTTPDPAIVACTEQQLGDLIRFCAPPTGVNCSIRLIQHFVWETRMYPNHVSRPASGH
jgi:hypothetical protein